MGMGVDKKLKAKRDETIVNNDKRKSLFSSASSFDAAIGKSGLSLNTHSVLMLAAQNQIDDPERKVNAHDLKQLMSDFGKASKDNPDNAHLYGDAYSAVSEIYIRRANDIDYTATMPNAQPDKVAQIIEMGRG